MGTRGKEGAQRSFAACLCSDTQINSVTPSAFPKFRGLPTPLSPRELEGQKSQAQGSDAVETSRRDFIYRNRASVSREKRLDFLSSAVAGGLVASGASHSSLLVPHEAAPGRMLHPRTVSPSILYQLIPMSRRMPAAAGRALVGACPHWSPQSRSPPA